MNRKNRDPIPIIYTVLFISLFALSAYLLIFLKPEQKSDVPLQISSAGDTANTTSPSDPPEPIPEEVVLTVNCSPNLADVIVDANASVDLPGQIATLTCSVTNVDGEITYTSTVSSSDAKWEILNQSGVCTLNVTAVTADGTAETHEEPITFTQPKYIWPVEPQYQMLLHDGYQVSSGYKTVGGLTHNNGLMRQKHYVYGNKRNHYGFDITAAPNSTVRAVSDGKVLGIYTDTDSTGTTGYGKYMIIKHTEMRNGLFVYTLYAHLNKTLVSSGDKVVQGQEIALSGNTGGSRIPHLHLEIRIGENDKSYAVNPLELLPARDFSLRRSYLEESDGFLSSSVQLYSNMLTGEWNYVIPARANTTFTRSGVTIEKGTQVEVISRSGSTVRFIYGGTEFSCPVNRFDYTFDF